MALRVETGSAPSYWESYLVNGDSSGLDSDDIKQADAFARWLGGSIVDCEDAGFMWHHDAIYCTEFRGGADCQTYSALVEGESV